MTTRTPLLSRRDTRNVPQFPIFGNEIFLDQDWKIPISLDPLTKLAFRRTRFGAFEGRTSEMNRCELIKLIRLVRAPLKWQLPPQWGCRSESVRKPLPGEHGALLDLDAGLVDDRFPLAGLLFQRCGKLIGGSNPCVHAESIQAGADLC